MEAAVVEYRRCEAPFLAVRSAHDQGDLIAADLDVAVVDAPDVTGDVHRLFGPVHRPLGIEVAAPLGFGTAMDDRGEVTGPAQPVRRLGEAPVGKARQRLVVDVDDQVVAAGFDQQPFRIEVVLARRVPFDDAIAVGATLEQRLQRATPAVNGDPGTGHRVGRVE